MKRFPILPFFFISWIIFFVLALGWSIILRIDYSVNEIMFQISQKPLLIDVLASYGLATALTLYKMIPYPIDEEELEKAKNKTPEKKLQDAISQKQTTPKQSDQ